MKHLLKNVILPALAFVAAGCAEPAPEPFAVQMLPGECWWGAFDNPSAWQILEAGGI